MHKIPDGTPVDIVIGRELVRDTITFQGETTSVTFSLDKRYRYNYEHYWTGNRSNLLGFIMLNPSTADVFIPDATIRTCVARARKLGYNGIRVVNLFPYRSRNPLQLVATARSGIDICHSDINNDFIHELFLHCPDIVAAWGLHARRLEVEKYKPFRQIAESLQLTQTKLFAINCNTDGSPSHPLYQSLNDPLKPYDFAA